MNQKSTATNPGIVVLSFSLQLLYMNQQAISLLKRLRQSASQLGADRNMTAALEPFAHDIVRAMRDRLAVYRVGPFHHSLAIGEGKGRIALKGFGLPDRRGVAYSRIVLLLSPEDHTSNIEYRSVPTTSTRLTDIVPGRPW